MKPTGREALFAAGLSLLFAVATAGAEPDPGESPGPGTAAPAATAVEIVVVGTVGDLARVRELGPRPSAAPVKTTWSRVDAFHPTDLLRPGPSGVVRCWIDLREGRRAHLYFSAATSERFLVRDVELSGRFDALDRAALAEVLEVSIEALIENDRVGLSRTEAEAMLARRAPPPPSPPVASVVPAFVSRPSSPLASAPSLVRQATHFEWGGFYAAQALDADDAIAHGPGVSVALVTELERGRGQREGEAQEAPSRRFLSAWTQGQYRLPAHARGAEAAVRLDTVALRAGIELATRRWGARLGLGADLVHVDPEAITPALVTRASRWSSSFVVTAALRAGTHLAPRVRVSLVALLDVLPTAVDYGVSVDGRLAPVFSPWRLRPGCALELTAF